MTNSLIVSLAYLKVNCDLNRSGYIDNFVPLVAECLREQSEPIVSANNLQKSLLEKFGMQIPKHVITALLARAKRRNYVYVQNHVYYRNVDILNGLSFQNSQIKVQRIYNALIDDFIKFFKEKYGRDIDNFTAENLLLSFISYNQLTIFKGETDFKILPDYPPLTREEKIIVADYITSAQVSRPLIYDYIETIVKGYMIVNALYLSDVDNYNKKFQRTKFIFDTSFVIYALGFSGEEMQSPCIELLDLLYANGAQLYCFRHTVDEIEGILNACSLSLGTYSDTIFGRSVQYFTSHGYKISDIQLLISSLERKIESLRLYIIDKPDYSNYQHVIDEDKLNNLLRERFIHPQEKALSRDVDSVAGIYRLRRGHSNTRIEESKAIFVTTNKKLALAVNEFYYEEHNGGLISPCITDFALTTYVWLKTPTKAPNLPMKRLIADCYASIQPDDELMERWFSEIEKLSARNDISVEDYYFLRYSDEARRALVEYSLSDPEVIVDGSVQEILSRAKKLIVEESARQLENSLTDLDAEIKRRKAVEKELIYLSQSRISADNARLSRLNGRANSLAKKFTIFLRVLSFVILVGGLVLTIPFNLIGLDDFYQSLTRVPRIILAPILLLGLIINTLSQFFGTPISTFYNKIEVSLSKRIFKIFDSISN